ncbi:TFIIE alpha subunit-domain-containing protein [Apodospora peruviana]|uniref:TFIIE alpha subunit-domain-containing protein n=1 Tax=Apodospora peruviana TaxID=516989 RepID=A0AAE0IIU4_9PEZI|nr:TFIIE alpha subunit-domain-containing protein [Apodospora peruviana]
MEVAQTLVRCVMRAFYTTQEILVVDALITHSALRDDELACLLKMNLKDLHKLCASLRDARFLTVHARPELQEGKTRPINRTYYYIDYRQTIDAIKWRVHKTDKDMQIIAQPADEFKEYTCPRCTAQWSQMEVLDSISAQGFLCQRCGNLLELSKEREAPGHQKLSRMNNQFKFMTDLLQQVDNMIVPESSFDSAIQHARPIEREATHEVAASVPFEGGTKPSAVKGMADTGPKTMQVTISDGNDEQEGIENRKRKERLLAENALPSWITESSVPVTSSTSLAASIGGIAPKREQQFDVKMEDDHCNFGEDDDASRAKRVKLEVKTEVGMPSAAPDEDEDDLDFEDVL